MARILRTIALIVGTMLIVLSLVISAVAHVLFWYFFMPAS
jgi:hypothetical protein